MKNEVNRALMAKKKQYIYPLTEVKKMNTALMQAFGPASMPNDQFHNAPARKPDNEAPVF